MKDLAWKNALFYWERHVWELGNDKSSMSVVYKDSVAVDMFTISGRMAVSLNNPNRLIHIYLLFIIHVVVVLWFTILLVFYMTTDDGKKYHNFKPVQCFFF